MSYKRSESELEIHSSADKRKKFLGSMASACEALARDDVVKSLSDVVNVPTEMKKIPEKTAPTASRQIGK